MRGPNLLLAHLESMARLVAEEPEPSEPPRVPARERLEAELGPELARELVAALARPLPPSK
jgi:hypothetical protein